jgi:hypothetical protein
MDNKNMEQPTCKRCGMAASSPMAYKCDMCGAEAKTHDEKHSCGGDHCVVKCSGCGKAETQCSCK